jgi:L-ascorbate metabolism protein UlaG (beta-lactamase superfamily)
MSIKVTWFSHSGFQLNIGGTTVLIDPFLSGNPLAVTDANSIAADYILLTHAHEDHLGDTEPIARRTGAMVIGVWEIAQWAGRLGLNAHAQNTGGGFQHPFGHVKFVRADHSSSFPDGSYGGQACGIVLSAMGKRLYFAGDTALYSDMRLVGAMGIDVAFLPIGDNFTMGPDESVEAIKLIQPKSAFPIHYNTFDVIVQDAAAWARSVNNSTQTLPLVVDPGGEFTVE